jgi:hypothetical protein
MSEKDPVKRLHNLCDWMESQKDDSPYSVEAWEDLQSENDRLRQEIKNCCAQHEQAASKLFDIQEAIRNCFGRSPMACDNALYVSIDKYNKLVEVVNK